MTPGQSVQSMRAIAPRGRASTSGGVSDTHVEATPESLPNRGLLVSRTIASAPSAPSLALHQGDRSSRPPESAWVNPCSMAEEDEDEEQTTVFARPDLVAAVPVARPPLPSSMPRESLASIPPTRARTTSARASAAPAATAPVATYVPPQSVPFPGAAPIAPRVAMPSMAAASPGVARAGAAPLARLPPPTLPPIRPRSSASSFPPADVALPPFRMPRPAAPSGLPGARAARHVLAAGALVCCVGGAAWLLRPRVGTVTVLVSGPRDAAIEPVTVAVDGWPRCKASPCTIELESGTRALHVQADGYLSHEQGIAVAPGSSLTVSVVLHTKQSSTILRTGSRSNQ